MLGHGRLSRSRPSARMAARLNPLGITRKASSFSRLMGILLCCNRAPMFRSWRRMIEPRRLQMTRAHTTRAEFQNCDTVWRKLPRNFALSASISDPVFPHRKCGLSHERFSVRHPHKRKRPCPSATFNQIGCWSDYLRSCRWVCRRVGIRRAAERRNRSPRYLRQTRPHALYPPE